MSNSNKIVWEFQEIRYMSQTYTGKVGSVLIFNTEYKNDGVELICGLPGIQDRLQRGSLKEAQVLAEKIWELWCNKIKGEA